MDSNKYKTSWFGNLIRIFLLALGRAVFALRYKVKINGLESLDKDMKKTLVLPNHPAYSDPCLVYTHLWRHLRMRPMISSGIVNNPVLFWLKWLTRPVVVPQMDVQSTDARSRAQAALDLTIEGLRGGTNHLVYPAGRLYKWDHEHLGSVKGLTEILKAVPDARIVRVRTKGMWGSSFSYAYTGKKPKLVKMLFGALFSILANLIFFMPRREITIDLEEVDRADLPELRRDLINPYFENWYNEGGPEVPVFRPYHFLWGAKEYAFPPLQNGPDIHPRDIKRAIQRQVNAMIEERLQRTLEPEEIKPSARLEVIGLDSLERMELSLDIEKEFQSAESSHVPQTLLEAWALAAGLLNEEIEAPIPTLWEKEVPINFDVQGWEEALPKGDNILQSILHRVSDPTTSRAAAVADSMSGVLSYQRFWVGANLLAKRFERLNGDKIGLMLPASVGADIAMTALWLAGKTPVLLNWTTGLAHMDHAINFCDIEHIVTSQKFLDRANVELPEQCHAVLLEEIRQQIGLFEKLGTLFRTSLFPKSYAKKVEQASPEDIAAILFTSGSEKAPKCVPLTHKNILSAVRGGIEGFQVNQQDRLLGFLPPFHVFGLVVSAMALCSGVRMVHHPDPTAGGSLARKIKEYGVTVVAAAPTFLNYILDRAKPGALASIRLAVVGAEKCPQTVFEKFRQKAGGSGLILEAYGITECAAAVAGNTPTAYKEGTLGKPLPGAEILIADPESNKPVGQGESGMIMVRGDIVMSGYLGDDVEDPFVMINGEQYYKSGDIASLDEEGFVHFEGRLKRFVKIGGEMLSLPAMEQPFVELYPPNEDGPQVAIEAIETDSGPSINLFTTVDGIDLVKANGILAEYGFKGVVRLHNLRFMPEGLPLLGSGKTDYKALKALLQSEFQNGTNQ